MVQDPRTATGADRVRPLNAPRPAAVEPNAHGEPAAVVQRGGAYRRIARIDDTWRIDDEWWREEISRRYFAVAMENGKRITLYHDLIRDLWYEQPYTAPEPA